MEANKIVINYHENSNGFNQISFIKDGEILTIEPFQMQEHGKYLNLEITKFARIGVHEAVEEFVQFINQDEQLQAEKYPWFVEYVKRSNQVTFLNMEPNVFLGYLGGRYDEGLIELVHNHELYDQLLRKYNLELRHKPEMDDLTLIRI
jgi:hypothetical protein